MTKVVYIYVYPSYTFASLVQKINAFYKNEFDKDTHVYFVGVFTKNEKIVYDYDNEEQISIENLYKIQQQIFSTTTNIQNIKTFERLNSYTRTFQQKRNVFVNIPLFLEKYKQKGDLDLQNLRWSTHQIERNFFILTGNLYENKGIHCDTIGAKRFLSQIHFLQKYKKQDDIFCGIDFKTCIVRRNPKVEGRDFERVSYGQSINEMLSLRDHGNNNFVLGLEKGSFGDGSNQDDNQAEVNTLYKMIIVSQPTLETTFYNPFLSMFKEDVYFLSNIPKTRCRKNRNLIACKFFSENTAYPTCAQNLEMEKPEDSYFKNSKYHYRTYKEYYPKYFHYLVHNFNKYEFTNNFITNDTNTENFVWFFFQKKKASPSNGFTCNEIKDKAKDGLKMVKPGKRTTETGKINKTSHNIDPCGVGEYLLITDDSFSDHKDPGKCNFNTYKKNTFKLLYCFAEKLTEFAKKQQAVQDKNNDLMQIQDQSKQESSSIRKPLKISNTLPKKTKLKKVHNLPEKLKSRVKPTKIVKPKTIDKSNKRLINIGDRVKVKYLMTNGQKEWFEGMVKNKTKQFYKVRFPREGRLSKIAIDSKDIRKM
jgi:hypothetical protein